MCNMVIIAVVDSPLRPLWSHNLQCYVFWWLRFHDLDCGVHVELNMSSLFMLTCLMACDSWSMDNFSSKWLLNALFLATKHGYQFVYPQYCKCLLGFQLCCSYGLYALGPIWDSMDAAWRCAHSSRFNYYMNNYMYGYSFLLFSYMKNCMHRFCFRSTNYSLQPPMLNC